MKNKKNFKFYLLIIIITLLIFSILININKICFIYDVIVRRVNIKSEIENNEMLMGLSDVSGEGLEINVTDGSDLIHQEDLIILIDELKNAGSQSISVNNIRIVNSTYIFCDGSVILIDGVKIGNPFLIKAIGNSETMYGAITRNNGYIETLKKSGLTVNVEKKSDITIYKSNKISFKNYKNMSNNLNKLYTSNILTGKSNIIDTGLEITITENKSKLTAVSFLQIINDLNSSGGTAISINDNRITNMTDIMDISKKYILINSNIITSPYTIKVIGNQKNLTDKINASNSYFTKIKNASNNIDIKYKKVDIKQYTQKNDQNKMNINYLNIQ